jgi:hypothetical protein
VQDFHEKVPRGSAASDMAPHRFVLPAGSRPGSPSSRAERIEPCVAYTPAMVATENEYHARGLIAISICEDPWFRVTRDAVQDVVGRWLEIPRCDVGVD